MKVSSEIEVPYSVVLLMGTDQGVPPETMVGSLVQATKTCVAIGTRPAVDGATTFLITDEGAPVGRDPAFLGTIEGLEGEIGLYTAALSKICSMAVEGGHKQIAIFVDDDSEPGEIIVSISR